MREQSRHRNRVAQARAWLLLGALLTAFAAAGAAAAQSITPQTLFELSYGDAEDEIGVEVPNRGEGRPIGPAGLAVGRSGDVYISDYVQRRVKRFDQDGNLVTATEGEAFNLGRPAVGPNGEMLVVAGAGANEILMFDPDGTRVTSVRDEDGVVIEARGGDYILGQIGAWMTSHGLHPRVHPSFLYFDATGRFFVGVWGPDFEPGVVGARGRVFVFTPDLRITAVMLGDFVDPQGRVYSASGPWVERISRRFEVRAPDGTFLGEVDIPSPQTTAQILPWMGGEKGGVWYYMVDQVGSIYLVDLVSRVTTGKEPFFLTESLWVNADTSVVRLDSRGALLAALRLPGRPFSNCKGVFVAPSGDIYYFDFGPESVGVNVIYADSLAAAASQSPSKIVAVRSPLPPEQRTVALRRGLDAPGWHFAWDSASRRAVANKAGVRVEVAIGSREARINGATTRLARPAYLASGRTRVPCSFIAQVARITGG
ncbi:MAG: hypothetical protein JSV65_10310 [Armatimonadota bacterium]|nr:MAG: hypothetical protein JSV65_10310 [Armatimonadota bacterium]